MFPWDRFPPRPLWRGCETLNGCLPLKYGPIRFQTLGNAFQKILDISFFDAENAKKKMQNFERPFTPEDGSVWPQTLGKRVSGDPRHFIFRRPQTFFATKHFGGKIFRQQQSACFGGAVQVYTPLANAARKFIARHNIGFSLLRPLVEG